LFSTTNEENRLQFLKGIPERENESSQVSKIKAQVLTQHQPQHVLTQETWHLSDIWKLDPQLCYARYLRSFDELDPHSTVDGVKDEGWPFTRGVMLLTVLTDRLKRLKKRLFHNRSWLLDLCQEKSQVSIARCLCRTCFIMVSLQTHTADVMRDAMWASGYHDVYLLYCHHWHVSSSEFSYTTLRQFHALHPHFFFQIFHQKATHQLKFWWTQHISKTLMKYNTLSTQVQLQYKAHISRQHAPPHFDRACEIRWLTHIEGHALSKSIKKLHKESFQENCKSLVF